MLSLTELVLFGRGKRSFGSWKRFNKILNTSTGTQHMFWFLFLNKTYNFHSVCQFYTSLWWFVSEMNWADGATSALNELHQAIIANRAYGCLAVLVLFTLNNCVCVSVCVDIWPCICTLPPFLDFFELLAFGFRGFLLFFHTKIRPAFICFPC